MTSCATHNVISLAILRVFLFTGFVQINMNHFLLLTGVSYPPGVASKSSGHGTIGKWNECPANLVTYTGCTVTVHALFLPSTGSCLQGDIVFHVRLKTRELHKMVESIGSHCFVSASFFDVDVGSHDLTFIAQSISPDYNPSILQCADHLIVESSILAPTMNGINVTCKGVLVQWSPPVLNANKEVEGYMIYIYSTTLSYHTTNTSLLIPYTDDGLEYNKQYTVSVFAKYCGGEAGNKVNTTFTTAMAPRVKKHQSRHSILKLNSTHVTALFHTKISSVACRVSHPKAVLVDVECVDYQPIKSAQSVTVTSDGTIHTEQAVPVDTNCAASLLFINHQFTTLIKPIHIETMQLKSCSYLPTNKYIVMNCRFSTFSTLIGCRGMATEPISGWNSSVDIMVVSGNTHTQGQLTTDCNGLYDVTCFGIVKKNSKEIVKRYHNVVTVTAGRDCIISPSIITSSQSTEQPVECLNDTKTIIFYVAMGSGTTIIIVLVVIASILVYLKKFGIKQILQLQKVLKVRIRKLFKKCSKCFKSRL